MQKISFLFLGTSLSLVPQTLSAQCVSPIQDCYALGYTQSSCPNGKGVKCPFGSGWYCGGTAAQDCIKLGYDKDCTGAGESGSGQTCNGKYQSCTCDSSYQYTCSGTGYSGGSGAACGGKYTTCTCTTNYTWNGGNCVLSCSSSYQYTCSGTGYAGGLGTACGGKYTSCNCSSGYVWKDGACQQQLNGAQGDLYYCNGTVVGVKASGMSFYVAMKDLGYMDWNSGDTQCLSYVFCNSLTGFMPSTSQLALIKTNKSTINTLLSANGGSSMSEGYYWSTDVDGAGGHYLVNMSSTNYGTGNFGMSSDDMYAHYVRPILLRW